MAQTHWYHFQSTLVWKIPEGGKVVSCSSITRNSQSWARIEGETGPGMRHQESFEQFLSAPSFTWHEYVVLTVRVFLWCLGVILWQNVWLFSWWKLLEFAFPPPPPHMQSWRCLPYNIVTNQRCDFWPGLPVFMVTPTYNFCGDRKRACLHKNNLKF